MGFQSEACTPWVHNKWEIRGYLEIQKTWYSMKRAHAKISGAPRRPGISKQTYILQAWDMWEPQVSGNSKNMIFETDDTSEKIQCTEKVRKFKNNILRKQDIRESYGCLEILKKTWSSRKKLDIWETRGDWEIWKNDILKKQVIRQKSPTYNRRYLSNVSCQGPV